MCLSDTVLYRKPISGLRSKLDVVAESKPWDPDNLTCGIAHHPGEAFLQFAVMCVGEKVADKLGVSVHAKRGDAVGKLPSAVGEG